MNDKRGYRLQQLSPSLDTGLESYSPLVNGPVNNGLFEVSADLNQSLHQFSQVAYWLLVYTLLHGTLDLHVGMFYNGGHNFGGMKSGILLALHRNSTVECMRFF